MLLNFSERATELALVAIASLTTADIRKCICLFVCMLFYGTSALVRLLVPHVDYKKVI